ncbi:MAG TPA: hypothetical protein VJ842_02190 [Pyrinomonadaceae bacterium]|nr:hypothetical protein [Pyrinomonadaceae bacterium]
MFKKKQTERQELKPKSIAQPSKSITASSSELISSEPKYPKPKILLVDVIEEAEAKLKTAGFTVKTGTFGTPYKVEKAQGYVPVARKFHLPNYAEQEIVIIDLAYTKIADLAPTDRHTVVGEYDYWAKRNSGVIDPRPIAAELYRRTFDNILSHGGVFVCFADSDIEHDILYARDTSRGLDALKDNRYSIWSFLTPLQPERFTVIHMQGSEMFVIDESHALGKLLRRHIINSSFECTLTSKQTAEGERNIYYENKFAKAWIPIVVNKYNAPLGGVFAAEGQIKGWIFVFPQIANKAQFLLEFLREVLPDLTPQLFPFSEGGKWIYREEYELPAISEIKSEIQKIEADTRSRIEVLEKAIEVKQQETLYLNDLLIESGDKLVSAVKSSLELMGFQKVLDMDQEMEKQGDTSFRREDLQILDKPMTLLVEVKGISGLPTDEAALQVQKYVFVRMKELKHTNVQGLEIINHQRNIPALDRDNKNPFREDILVNALEQQFGLLTTWDLYRLVRNYIKHKWQPEHVKDLFYKIGRIEPIPSHYEYVGTVERYLDKIEVMGIRIENAEIKLGDRIALELPIEFEEQFVISLQVDTIDIERASLSTLAGIKTHLSKQQVRIGTRVFRLK